MTKDTNRYSQYAAAGVAQSGTIVDLSNLIEPILNYEDVSSRLSDEQELRIVDWVRSATLMSYRKISKRYDHWREADRAHDVYVRPDATDFREKAVIADTRAIADTVLTYMMAALAGRNPMFQLEGLNRKSRNASLILERVLHQQMRRTAGEARIAQLLLDSIRYGFAPTKCLWDAKTNQNNIINFDPRRVFPDPRVSWGDWERMQYIVFSDFVSYPSLVQTGLYPKLREFPQLRHRLTTNKVGWEAHRWHKEQGRGLSIDPAQPLSRERMNHTFFTLGDTLAAETGMPFQKSAEGEFVAGTYSRRFALASGRFAMIDDGLGFKLVPWTPSIEKHIGRHISGVARADGGVDWSFGRKRGLGL